MAEVFGIVAGVLGLLPLCRGEGLSKLDIEHWLTDYKMALASFERS